jgi:hypothetical protein
VRGESCRCGLASGWDHLRPRRQWHLEVEQVEVRSLWVPSGFQRHSFDYHVILMLCECYVIVMLVSGAWHCSVMIMKCAWHVHVMLVLLSWYVHSMFMWCASYVTCMLWYAHVIFMFCFIMQWSIRNRVAQACCVLRKPTTRCCSWKGTSALILRFACVCVCVCVCGCMTEC